MHCFQGGKQRLSHHSLIVLRWVAVLVVRSNTTGAVDDLAAAFGAFGVIFLINYSSITTGLVDIRICARAAVQTDSEAVVVSKPVHAEAVGSG